MAHIAKLKIWDLWSEKFSKCVPILNIPSHRLVVWATPLTENLLMSQGRREKSWKSFWSQFYEAFVHSHISRQLTHWHNSQFSLSKAPVGDEENEFYGIDRTLLMNKIILCHFSFFSVSRADVNVPVHTPNSTVMSCRRPRIELRLCSVSPSPFLRSDSIWMRNLSANIFLFNSTSSGSFQLTFARRSDQHST